MKLTPGSKVKYATPLDEYEAVLEMKVLELRGNRVLVELPIEGFAILPTAVYLLADLVEAP